MQTISYIIFFVVLAFSSTMKAIDNNAKGYIDASFYGFSPKASGVDNAKYLVLGSQLAAQSNYLRFPFSQYVLNIELYDGSSNWKYSETLDANENTIRPPRPDQNWDVWYKEMKDFQTFTRAHMNDTTAYFVELTLDKVRSTSINFNKVAYDMQIAPGDKIPIDGWIDAKEGRVSISIDLQYKYKGEEVANPVRKYTRGEIFTVAVGDDGHFSTVIQIPHFDPTVYSVAPVIKIDALDDAPAKVLVRALNFSVPYTAERKATYEKLASMFRPASIDIDRTLYDRAEIQWVKSCYLMGFAFIWDNDFWDDETGAYRIREYCKKMEREFGGFQSVMIWYNYPNLGIDDKNQFDMLNAMPGGLDGLKKAVDEFHRHGVRVVLTYNGWDIDTRRPNEDDRVLFPKIVSQVGADGLFMDVGTYSFGFQPELEKHNRGIMIGPELTPAIQCSQGPQAVTSSWAQTTRPYDNQGVLMHKWIIPEHIQYRIDRFNRDRQGQLAFSWINGQGLVVWENVFGTMIKWNAKDRQSLRKMNAIWRMFYPVYTSDSFKPYMRTSNPDVSVSSWENDNVRIWNVSAAKNLGDAKVTFPVDSRYTQYYDLWTGEKLAVANGKVTMSVDRIGCVLGVRGKKPSGLNALLKKQREEHAKVLPVPENDPHTKLVSLKAPKPAPVPTRPFNAAAFPGLLKIEPGTYDFTVRHYVREGDCYPDMDAKDAFDYHIEVKNGLHTMIHHHSDTFTASKIMPRVVTNRQFEQFLRESGYLPRHPENFLKHWGGATCPPALLDEPVVYVSLADARAYADWYGMRMPTEWEWQAAAEAYPDQFRINEVWEWNESERTDGNNRSVILRGGCEAWMLKTSRWYFGGGSVASTPVPGGANRVDFHCKYYLMWEGLDRAATLGFRCISPQ